MSEQQREDYDYLMSFHLTPEDVEEWMRALAEVLLDYPTSKGRHRSDES